MQDTKPTVSVVIPVYNGAQWIDHALQSVFAQTYRDFEVIVVDDGSTDDLAEALRPWMGRITLVRQSNFGPAKARNAGIALAAGRLIAFLDADDEWLPEKLRLQVAYFDRYPEAGLVHTAVVGRNSGIDLQGPTFEPPQHQFCPIFHTDFFIRTLTVMVQKSVLLEVGDFDERREIHVEDWDLWLRIAARHPIGYLPRPLAIHRQGGHMSTVIDKTFAGQALVIEKNRGLCHSACPQHREAPDECLRAREHVLYWSWGTERLRRGNSTGAREAYARAIALRPWNPVTYVRYGACFLPERWHARVRELKHRLGIAGPESVPSAAEMPPRRTLVNDTVYGRARGCAMRAARALDESIVHAVRARRRILFEAASPMSFAIFEPVYRRLRADPRLEFWFTARGRAWKPTTIFSTVGITERVIGPDRAKWGKWDLSINTDFWEMATLHRRTRRVHLFHGVAGKYGLDAPVDLSTEIAGFACLMFPNEDRLLRYTEAALVPAGSPAAALVGYPKTDALVDGSLERRAICEALRLDADRPVVLFAPTWSPDSSLRMGEQIIDALSSARYQVIVKLHDRSYDRSQRGSGGVDWATRLSRYQGDPLVRVVRTHDASPYLVAADALVTDHSSVGFEFMLLDRPILVMDCPELLERSRVNPDKVQQLRSAADVVTRPTDLLDAVGWALARPARHSARRKEIGTALFYQPGTATERAVATLYNLLDMAAPIPEEVVRPSAVEETAA